MRIVKIKIKCKNCKEYFEHYSRLPKSSSVNKEFCEQCLYVFNKIKSKLRARKIRKNKLFLKKVLTNTE